MATQMRALLRATGAVLALGLAGTAWAQEPPAPPPAPSAGAEGGAAPGRPGEPGGQAGEKPAEPGKGPEGSSPAGSGSEPKQPAGGKGENAAPHKGAAEPDSAEARAKAAAAEAEKKKAEDEAKATDWLAGHEGHFDFGSYGRIIAATDGSGRPGRETDIVAHGSRLDEGNYVELELRRDDYWAPVDAGTRIVATLAIANSIFHYSGEFDTALAVRNMYVEEHDLGAKGLSIWAGSRMLRGDDIYLLDFWPLDNLNTVGAGVRYGFCGQNEPAPGGASGSDAGAKGDAAGKGGAGSAGEAKAPAPAKSPDLPPPWCTAVSAHFGLGQPNNPFYKQDVARAAPVNQFGQATVSVLDRQRWIASLRGEQLIRFGGTGGIKLVAYGEVHGVPTAQRETEQPEVYQNLPSDTGWVIGAQVGGFTGERDSHLNLFVRYARGLAAYGEFATPDSLALDRTATDAHEVLVAAGGNYEFGPMAVTLGAYFRSFRNANGQLDFEDLDEGIFLLRPQLFFVDWAGVALEGSYQVQQRGTLVAGLDSAGTTDLKPLIGTLGRIGAMLFITPSGPGAFHRPWIYLDYVASFRNEGARQLYPQDDVFRVRNIDHFVGLGAEWWFSSSSYGGQ